MDVYNQMKTTTLEYCEKTNVHPLQPYTNEAEVWIALSWKEEWRAVDQKVGKERYVNIISRGRWTRVTKQLENWCLIGKTFVCSVNNSLEPQ